MGEDNRKVADLSVGDLKAIIMGVTQPLVSEVSTEVRHLTTEVTNLRKENEELKGAIRFMKEESDRRFKEFTRLEDQIKRKNVVIKGLTSTNVPNEAVKELCTSKLNIDPQALRIRSVKKIFDRNNKMGVIAELDSEGEVYEILRNTNKLAGTRISIEKDLNSEKQEQKKVMLQLKKDIYQSEKTQRLTVRDERLRIGDKWFYWNRNKELSCGRAAGVPLMEQIYGKSLATFDFNYYNLLRKVNSNPINARY